MLGGYLSIYLSKCPSVSWNLMTDPADWIFPSAVAFEVWLWRSSYREILREGGVYASHYGSSRISILNSGAKSRGPWVLWHPQYYTCGGCPPQKNQWTKLKPFPTVPISSTWKRRGCCVWLWSVREEEEEEPQLLRVTSHVLHAGCLCGITHLHYVADTHNLQCKMAPVLLNVTADVANQKHESVMLLSPPPHPDLCWNTLLFSLN